MSFFLLRHLLFLCFFPRFVARSFRRGALPRCAEGKRNGVYCDGRDGYAPFRNALVSRVQKIKEENVEERVAGCLPTEIVKTGKIAPPSPVEKYGQVIKNITPSGRPSFQALPFSPQCYASRLTVCRLQRCSFSRPSLQLRKPPGQNKGFQNFKCKRPNRQNRPRSGKDA